MDKIKYHFEKMRNRKSGYPLATVAYYGPDDLFASKVVVGILASEKDGDLVNMRKWFSPDLDVRQDMRIAQEMLDFINENQVRRIAMVDRIIGCPHEEGIDYPDGEVCPQCPFWANRDRWKGVGVQVS
jgi:hypothetical protein